MKVEARMPADGPDAVLARMARLFDVALANGVIERSLAAHPRPTSLVALVDIGTQIGLDVKPVKATEDALGAVALPAIAHFDTPEGGGFGILESVEANGFRVWDRMAGARVIARDAFVEMWSGVLILVEPPRSDVGTSRKKRRLADAIAGPSEPPSVAGGPAARWTRGLLLSLFAIVLATGIVALPMSLRGWSALIAILATMGLVVTTTMTVAITDYGGPFSPGICKRGKLVDCQSVLSSRFARLFGFPLSELGLSFYAAVLLGLAVGATMPAMLAVIGATFVVGVPVAIILIGVQISMRRFCTLCLAVHAVNLGGAAISWFHFLDEPVEVADLGRAGAVFVLLFSIVTFLAIPYFKRNEAFVRVSETHGRMAVSPYASLAQLATESPTGLTANSCAIPLGEAAGRHELVAFLHPACNQCEPVLREMRTLARGGRVDTFVSLPPKDPSERPLCEALVAIGLAAGPDGFARAYSVAKRRFRELLATDPLTELVRELGLELDAVVSENERAQGIVAESESFATAHVEGTPLVFFDSIPYRGPLAHLPTLLTDHFELLPRRRRGIEGTNP